MLAFGTILLIGGIQTPGAVETQRSAMRKTTQLAAAMLPIALIRRMQVPAPITAIVRMGVILCSVVTRQPVEATPAASENSPVMRNSQVYREESYCVVSITTLREAVGMVRFGINDCRLRLPMLQVS